MLKLPPPQDCASFFVNRKLSGLTQSPRRFRQGLFALRRYSPFSRSFKSIPQKSVLAKISLREGFVAKNALISSESFTSYGFWV